MPRPLPLPQMAEEQREMRKSHSGPGSEPRRPGPFPPERVPEQLGDSLLMLVLFLFSCPVVFNSAAPWTAARQAPLSFTISCGLPKLMFIESVMPPKHLSSATPFFCLQSFPASGSFPVS